MRYPDENELPGISATSSWVSYVQSFWSASRLSTDLSISGFFGAEALPGNARARLSPVLYCLGRIAAASSGTEEAPLIGSLTQAIVAAAVEHREHDEFRRSIFFAVKGGDVMECACYAGYEG
jgi:hypothetical protein